MLRVVGGKVYAAKLSPANWNYFQDGARVDNVAKYETMVKVPPCYFKAQNKTMQFGVYHHWLAVMPSIALAG